MRVSLLQFLISAVASVAITHPSFEASSDAIGHIQASMQPRDRHQRTRKRARDNDSMCQLFWNSLSFGEHATERELGVSPPSPNELPLDVIVGIGHMLHGVYLAKDVVKYLVMDTEEFPGLYDQALNLQEVIEDYNSILMNIKWTLSTSTRSPPIEKICKFEGFLTVIAANELTAIKGELKYLRDALNDGGARDEVVGHVTMEIGSVKLARLMNRHLSALLD